MKTQEQEQEINEYQLKLVELFSRAPEGFNAIIIAGTVDKNNDKEDSLRISAFAGLRGKREEIIPLIRSSMKQDMNVEALLSKAVRGASSGKEISDLLEEFFTKRNNHHLLRLKN